MANSTRDSTAALRQPVSSASSLHSTFAKPHTSSPLTSSSHSLTHLANAGLSAAKHAFPSKYTMPPHFQPQPLTGAAAMADNRRWEEEQKELERRRTANMTSANPANTIRMGLQAPPISRPGDGPRGPFDGGSPSYVASPVDASLSQQSPLPLEVPERQQAAALNTNPKKRPASPRSEERSTKAVTYPPVLSVEEQRPRAQRNTSSQGSDIPSLSKSLSSGKKHKCPHCATEFTRHHNLKSHLLTHSQEKPYGCDTCSSRFRRLHDLKRHIKLHTGERSHACNKCGRRFARGDALARHNKGPGGCAGRRGSDGDGGIDDYHDDVEIDPSMEDSTYHNGDSQVYEEENSHFSAEARRRRSETNRRDTLGSTGTSISGSYHQHSSTYPGLAPLSRSFYAQPSGSHSGLDLSRAPQDMPAKEATAPAPAPTPSLFAPGIISESPAPLSPGTQDMQRANANSSLNLHLQERRFAAPTSGSTTSQQQFPAPLPSMNVFDTAESRFPPPSRTSNSTNQTSPNHTSQHNSVSSAAPSGGSHSSHGHSSIGSMRDILNSDAHPYSQELPPLQSQPPQDLLKQDGMLEYMKNMERRVEEQVARRLEEQMAERMREQEAQYKAQISRLNEQISSLTGQQYQQQDQNRSQQGQH